MKCLINISEKKYYHSGEILNVSVRDQAQLKETGTLLGTEEILVSTFTITFTSFLQTDWPSAAPVITTDGFPETLFGV